MDGHENYTQLQEKKMDISMRKTILVLNEWKSVEADASQCELEM